MQIDFGDANFIVEEKEEKLEDSTSSPDKLSRSTSAGDDFSDSSS